eukprot:gene17863-18092_t
MSDAVLLFRNKRYYDDGGIVELKIWRVKTSVPGSQQDLKYSLFYGREGERLVGYNNEAGKVDHRHYGDQEEAYTFSNVDQLVADVFADDLDAFRSAWRRAETGETIQENFLSFESWDALSKVLSGERIRLMRHVRSHPERSVNALAIALKRQYRRVHEDVQILEQPQWTAFGPKSPSDPRRPCHAPADERRLASEARAIAAVAACVPYSAPGIVAGGGVFKKPTVKLLIVSAQTPESCIDINSYRTAEACWDLCPDCVKGARSGTGAQHRQTSRVEMQVFCDHADRIVTSSTGLGRVSPFHMESLKCPHPCGAFCPWVESPSHFASLGAGYRGAKCSLRLWSTSELTFEAPLTMLGDGACAESGNGTYTYDSLGRLMSVATDDGKLISYAYDAAGNRTQVSTVNVPPIASAASLTVNYNQAGTVALNITGSYTTTAIATNAGHGSATISGATATYTPAAGYIGTDSFTYTATGSGGTSAPATVSVTVNKPAAPTVANASLAVNYNTAGSTAVTITGVYSSTAIATGAGHGTASISGATVSYTPASGYIGADSFTYTATGPGGTSGPATVNVNVNAPPAPTAANGTLTVAYNTAGSTPVTITGVYTSTAIVTAAGHGTASISGATVSYTPASGYTGTDSFTYKATGPGGTSAPATVNVTVNKPAAPTVANASMVVGYNTAATTTVTVSGVYSSTAIASGAGHGTASINGTTVSYTPASGYYGADSFTYTASGLGGTSAPATVSVTVGNPPAPTAGAASLSVGYNTAGSISVPVSGVYTSTAIATNPAHGTASINGTTVSYTPASGYYGADSFTYTASGPGGTSAQATVSVAVAYPDGLVVYRAGQQSGGAGAWSYTVPAGVTAVDVEIWGAGGNTLWLSNAGPPGGLSWGGSGGAYARKHLSVTPGQVLSGALGVGGSQGATTLTNAGVTAGGGVTWNGSSANGGTASGGDVNISGFGCCVQGVNRNAGGGAGYGSGDQTGYNAAGTFPGGGGSGGGYSAGGAGSGGQVIITVRAQLWNPPAPSVQNLSVAYANGGTGTVTLSASGSYTAFEIIGQPSSGNAQPSGANQATFNLPSGGTFTYVATGPGGTSAPATVTVAGPPPPPPTVANASLSVGYNGSGSTAVSISGNYTSTAIASGASHGSASINGATVSYTAASGYYGADSFTYVASGPGGTSAPATVYVTVGNPPAPTVPNASMSVGYNGSGSTGVAVAGVYTSTAIASGPSHGSASISGTTVSYSAASGYYGSDSFTYVASGPGGTSAPATVYVTVGNPPAPGASSTSMSVGYQTAGSVALPISGVYTSTALASNPANGSASVSGATAYYTPANGFSGSDSFTYIAQGPGGNSAPATVYVTVSAAPSISVAVNETTYKFWSIANAAQPGNTPNLVVTVSGGSGNYSYSGALVSGDGAITIVPSGNVFAWTAPKDDAQHVAQWQITVVDNVTGARAVTPIIQVIVERDTKDPTCGKYAC